jgi:hypothetical protein
MLFEKDYEVLGGNAAVRKAAWLWRGLRGRRFDMGKARAEAADGVAFPFL